MPFLPLRKKSFKLGGKAADAKFAPAAVIKSTEKVGKCSLLVQQRCLACHGRTVQEVVGEILDNGMRYKMADLRYDVKHGRLQLVKPGTRVAEASLSNAKSRSNAPCAGKPLPPSTIDEFFLFLQCALQMETREHTGKELTIVDKTAKSMWPDVEAFVTPNLGATERWVPYHTVLGLHELFLVQSVHHRKDWDEKQRFLAMFIFRAHCKCDLFNKVQLPQMLSRSFWRDPSKAFSPGGPMERAILSYRKKTGSPLITSCFRIIPERILKNDDENLVRSITKRTLVLLDLANRVYPLVKDKTKTAVMKRTLISEMVREANGLGDTWAKMLTVCIDLAYPKMKLLETQCDVGTGAAPPLRCLLPKGGPADTTQALHELLKVVNKSSSPSAKCFWQLLQKNEKIIRARYKKFPLVCAQAKTKIKRMSAVTLQVQLCEYRQYRHDTARRKYGLADDESMRSLPQDDTRKIARNFTTLDEKRRSVTIRLPGSNDISMEVPIKLTGNHQRVAERVAAMCFNKLRDGSTKEETLQFRDELLKGYKGGKEAAEDSDAWEVCRASGIGTQDCPVVAFDYVPRNGSKFHFQTTIGRAGSVLEAERIARLCWAKIDAGLSKEKAFEYRNWLYKQSEGCDGSPAKKHRVGGS